jgi:hypothetical protein
VRVHAPDFLPQRGWSRHTKGYAIFTSRCAKLKRGTSLHRAVVEHLLGHPIPGGLHVQHLFPFIKACGRPESLLLAPPEFNPSGAMRDPFTGEFMSVDAYQRRYGGGRVGNVKDSEVPF